MSFKLFAIRFNLNKKEYRIFERAKKYPFLNQEYLLSLEENEIPAIAKKFCGDNESFCNQFEWSV